VLFKIFLIFFILISSSSSTFSPVMQKISLFSISPILFFFPLAIPTCIETAPLPLVFHGIFGFNLTSLGYPIIS
jgi:hypothetical protein